MGFPVFVHGGTDKDRTFHPFCIAVCSSEGAEDFEFVFRALKKSVEAVTGRPYEPKLLMADAAAAI